jgi:hypothetical protein
VGDEYAARGAPMGDEAGARSRTWGGTKARTATVDRAQGRTAGAEVSERARAREALDRFGPWCVLLLSATAAAALAAIWGLRIHGIVIFDETLNVIGGRYIDQHFPHALFEAAGGIFPRGPERLTASLFAAGNRLSGQTATQLKAAHVLLAIAYAATTIPTYAMARLIGLGRWWAAGAGALAVCTPFLLFGATLLNTSLSLLTAAIALWAYLRCLLKPSWRTDAVAVLATGLMATARVSYGGLGVVLVIAVVIQAWRDQPGRGGLTRLLRDHWLLLGVAALAVVYLGVHGLSQASGYAGVSATPSLSAIWAHLRNGTGQLAVAFALAPFAIALAWVVRAAIRPYDRPTGAFATLALTSGLALAYINQFGDLEDRYTVALLPIVAVAVAAPLARRELRWLEVGLAGLLTARAVSTTQSTPDLEGFSHFVYTTDTWFADVWIGRARLYLHLGSTEAVTLVTVGAAALATALAVVAQRARRHWQWVAGVVLVATAAVGFMGAWYSAAKLVPPLPGLSTESPRLHPASFAQAAFVDEDARAPVGVLDYLTHDPGVPQQWTGVEMFNGRIQATVRINGQSSGFTCCLGTGRLMGLSIDQNTGAVAVAGGNLPPYLVSVPGWTPGAVVTELITTSPVTYPLVSLERTVLPPRAAWTAPGVPADGWGEPGKPLRLRVFPAALVSLQRPCLYAAVTAPPVPASGVLLVAAGSTRVAIPPGAAVAARVPLAAGSNRPQDVLIRASRSGVRADGARVTVGLSGVRVASCSL